MQLTGSLKYLDIGTGMWMFVTDKETFMIGATLPSFMQHYTQGTRLTVRASEQELMSTAGTANKFIDISQCNLVD